MLWILAALPAIALNAPIFQNDFSAQDDIHRFDRVSHAHRMDVVNDPDDPANTVLRINVKQGDHYGGSLSVLLRNHLKQEPDRLYFRYRLRFDSSWHTTTSGKLPGFGGTYQRAGWGGKPSDGTNGWSARGMFAPTTKDGTVPIGSYIYHADMVDQGKTYGVSERWGPTLKRDRWYTIEQEIKLDSPEAEKDNADGSLKAWVDGKLVYDRQNLHVRDTDDLRIETVWLNIYHGGKAAAPKDMHLLIDDLWVAESRPSTSP